MLENNPIWSPRIIIDYSDVQEQRMVGRKASLDDGLALLLHQGAGQGRQLQDLEDVLLLESGAICESHSFGQPGQGDAGHQLQDEVHLGSVADVAKIERVFSLRKRCKTQVGDIRNNILGLNLDAATPDDPRT